MIFLSYCWKNEEIANAIDSYFSENNKEIIRDKRDLKYKQSIKAFMKTIRDAEYVIMIISKEYLKSKNCMYEVTEFVKNKDFKDRIIPIVIKESKIFDVHKRVEYSEYWKNKREKLEVRTSRLSPQKALPIFQELKEYENIESEIADFLDTISDMNNVVISQKNYNKKDFDIIRNYINFGDIHILYDLNADKNIRRNLGAFNSEDGVFENLEYYISKGEIVWGVFSSINNKFKNLELFDNDNPVVWRISSTQKESVGINLFNLPSKGTISFEYYITEMNLKNPNIIFYLIGIEKKEKLIEVGSDTYDEENAPFSNNRKKWVAKKILNQWISKTIEYDFDDSELKYVVFAPRINEGCGARDIDNAQIIIRNIIVKNNLN